MTYTLGIDVGTTFTAAAVWRPTGVETVVLGEDTSSVPSVIFLHGDGSVLVGDAANRAGLTDLSRVAREFKRRVGDAVPIVLGDVDMDAHVCIGHLIRYMVDRVEEREGGRPDRVVLTHPADWGMHRLELLREAARLAGLEQVDQLAEPVAAATHYASLERVQTGTTVAVYDLGGGTFDAAVVRKVDAGFELVGRPMGDNRLGGVDFDDVLMNRVIDAVGTAWSQLDMAEPSVIGAVTQVRENVIAAKKALSSDDEATILAILPTGTRQVRVTRDEFEAAIQAPLIRTVATLRQTIATTGLTASDIDRVLLVGGSSRIPLIKRMISDELRVAVRLDAHPKYAICLGAALMTGQGIAAAGPAAEPAPRPPAPAPPKPRRIPAAVPIRPPDTSRAPTGPSGVPADTRTTDELPDTRTTPPTDDGAGGRRPPAQYVAAVLVVLAVVAATALVLAPRLRTTEAAEVAQRATTPAPASDPPSCAPQTIVDEFDADTIDRDTWEVINEDSDALEVDDNALILQMRGDDFYADGDTPVNLVLRSVPDGPWQATALIVADIETGWQQAGIVAYHDDDNYAKVDMIGRPPEPDQGRPESNRMFEFIVEHDGKQRNELDVDTSDQLPRDFPTRFLVRLTSDGSQLTAGFSQDGGTWIDVGRPIAVDRLWDVRVGPYALFYGAADDAGPSIEARFDRFELELPPPEGCDPTE